MKYNSVYVVMRGCDVDYVTTEKEKADDYADFKSNAAMKEVLEEWDNDDPNVKDIAYACFQAGGDGDYYHVEKVDLSNRSEDDTVKINGDDIDVSEILEKLKNDEYEDEYEYEYEDEDEDEDE